MSVPKSGLASLNGLKVASLQNIARLTGVSPSGTKSVLQARLDASLTHGKLAIHEPEQHDQDRPLESAAVKTACKQILKANNSQDKTYRILSIDMGIRNLAFCMLELDRQWLLPEKTGSLEYGHQGYLQSLSFKRPRIRVKQWHRLALGSDSSSTPASSDVLSPITTPSSVVGQESDISTEPLMSTLTKELFSPPHLAPLAWSVVSSLVLEQKSSLLSSTDSSLASIPPPDTVLIERQRWRSGGGSAVQEWTLRVNSLEAMLWSSLQTLQAVGIWRGQVHAVDPRTVSRFWLPDAKELTGRKGKEAKIGVVRGMLAVDEQFDGSEQGSMEWIGQADRMKKAFIAAGSKSGTVKREKTSRLKETTGATKAKGKSRNRPVVNDEDVREAESIEEQAVPVSKKDDLADCLLQGLAWVRWEENRRAFLSKGAL